MSGKSDIRYKYVYKLMLLTTFTPFLCSSHAFIRNMIDDTVQDVKSFIDVYHKNIRNTNFMLYRVRPLLFITNILKYSID